MPYTRKERSTFEGELLHQARLDGYLLDFALVLGADLVDFGAERLKADLNDKVEPTVISCDGLRPVERDENGVPKYLMTGYSSWKVSPAANKRLLKTLRKGEHSIFAVLQLLYPQKAKIVGKKVSTRGKEERARSALKESLRISGDAWTYFWLKAPHLQFHFLPLPIDAVGGAGSELSATRIRRIIRDSKKSSASKLGTALADVSLSPRLLAEMVKERQEEKARKKARA